MHASYEITDVTQAIYRLVLVSNFTSMPKMAYAKMLLTREYDIQEVKNNFLWFIIIRKKILFHE